MSAGFELLDKFFLPPPASGGKEGAAFDPTPVIPVLVTGIHGAKVLG